MTGLTYDAGALIAAERDDPVVWRLHRQALRRGILPLVPAPVLGQVWRGGPQHRLSQLLRGCRVEPLDELSARTAGALLATSSSPDLVDAVVVAGATRRGDLVLTSDPDDLHELADGAGVRLAMRTV